MWKGTCYYKRVYLLGCWRVKCDWFGLSFFRQYAFSVQKKILIRLTSHGSGRPATSLSLIRSLVSVKQWKNLFLGLSRQEGSDSIPRTVPSLWDIMDHVKVIKSSTCHGSTQKHPNYLSVIRDELWKGRILSVIYHFIFPKEIWVYVARTLQS